MTRYKISNNTLPTKGEDKCHLHFPEVNRKTKKQHKQQIMENIGYGLGVTP